MRLNPKFDQVIIVPSKPKEVTEGGIILPQSAQKNDHIGTVIGVGPGIFSRYIQSLEYESTWLPLYEPMHFEVGDTVLYSKYAGTDVEFDGETYKILRQDSIFGTIDPDELSEGGC